MNSTARMTTVILFCVLIAWVGSYVAFRWNNSTPGGFVTATIITYPAGQPMLIKVFEPLAEIDATLTGTQSRFDG